MGLRKPIVSAINGAIPSVSSYESQPGAFAPVSVLDLPASPAVVAIHEEEAAPQAGSDRPTAWRRCTLQDFFRGRESDPAWVRPALLTLLTATAVLYLWDLGASSWANTFYTAAVQAGSKSWKAMLFGSSDSSNFITLDKTPSVHVANGDFGSDLWAELLDRIGAPSPRGRCDGGPRLPFGTALVQCAGRVCWELPLLH